MSSGGSLRVVRVGDVVVNADEDESLALAEIIRKVNEEKIKEIRDIEKQIRTAKLQVIVFALVSVVYSILAILYLPLPISLVGLLIPVVFILMNIYKMNKLTKQRDEIHPDYKIEEMGEVNYPILLANVQNKPVVLDLGPHSEFKFLSFKKYEDPDKVITILKQVNTINDTYKKEILISSEGSKLLKKIEMLGKIDSLREHKALEGVFLQDVEDVDKEIVNQIGEETIQTRFIVFSDDEENELQSILETAKQEDVFDLSALGENVLLGIKPDEVARSAEEIFLIADELAAEHGDSDIKLASRLYNHIEAYRGVYNNMELLLNATIPSDIQTFEQAMYEYYCTHCSEKYIDEARDVIDIVRWVDMKILGGNITNDPDLNAPEELIREDALNLKEKVLNFMKKNLPEAHMASPIVIANGPRLYFTKSKELRCERCGGTDFVRVPKIFVTLARAYATVFAENRESMQNKANVIIRNIHESKLSKDQRITQLTAYKAHIEKLTKEVFEYEAKVKEMKDILQVIESLRYKR